VNKIAAGAGRAGENLGHRLVAPLVPSVSTDSDALPAGRNSLK
jgi:hypothetical protein